MVVAFSIPVPQVCCDLERVFYMPDSTRNLHSNTVAFACLEPQVAILILDVIAALVSVLRWRQSSQSLLIAILSRLAESPSFELTHSEFSAALWLHLKDSAREEKFYKWLTRMKEDIALSNCAPVRVANSRKERHPDGSFKSLPTLYLPGIFWLLFRAVQDAAMKCDLLSEIDVRKRRAKIRGIVSKWLKESGALPIERAKKAEEVKPAKPSLPCSCACVSCAQCAAKAPAPASLPSVLLERTTKQDVAEWFDGLGDQLFDNGVKWANLGLDTIDFWQKLANQIEIADQRLSDAIKRHNAPKKLKMNGGQSK